MARDFADDIDAGRKLAAVIRDEFDVVVAVLPTCDRLGAEVANALNLPMTSVERRLQPDADEPVTIGLENLTAHLTDRLLVVDDAVESGRTSIAIGVALKSAGYENVTLAVPVCPRDSEPSVRPYFDDIIAVVRPLMRRSLSWHYDVVPGNG